MDRTPPPQLPLPVTL